ncbi:MAG: hypothetical protein ACXWLN_27580 [Thermoanaerobaculia bacterium]
MAVGKVGKVLRHRIVELQTSSFGEADRPSSGRRAMGSAVVGL